MNKEKRLEIFARLAEAIPEPVTELNYNSTFELLVAVVLSAQATDKGVNKATAILFPVANTPQAIYDLGEQDLKDYIKLLGLRNDIPNLLNKSHCLLMPSLWEGLPIVILEAGASRLPVISTPVGRGFFNSC